MDNWSNINKTRGKFLQKSSVYFVFVNSSIKPVDKYKVISMRKTTYFNLFYFGKLFGNNLLLALFINIFFYKMLEYKCAFFY